MLESCNRQPHPLAPIADSSAKKEGSQVLLYGAWANAQLAGDFLIAASLDQQVEHLLVSRRNLDSIEIHHEVPL
jgi:hypothetical protein